jgi:ATPase subunit of ABC transporter with duplicated ATPase domains
VVSRIVEIEGGEFTSYTGNYDNYVRERALAEANREATIARQQAMLAKERRFIERFKAQAAHAAQVQSRVKKLEKIEVVLPPPKRRVVQFNFATPPRSGDDVLVLEGVGKRFGARVVYDDFNLMIRRRERWCVMGRNGAGKTTLLKLVAGALEPDAGTVRLGASLKVGYFAQQSIEQLDPKLTAFEQVQREFPLANQGTLRSLLGAFQFSGVEADKQVRVLSGGERSRLVLAIMLFDPPNFLILDEPTNHLDLESKEMLVSSLSNFEGTMLFVSHDRAFLRGLSTRVLELRPGDGAGGLPEPPLVYDGTYSEFVARTGSEAAGVHR